MVESRNSPCKLILLSESGIRIVTEFDLMTNPSLDIYYEIQNYSVANTPALLKTYAEYIADPETDPKSSVQIQSSSRYTLAFYGDEAHTNNLSAFDKFRSIPVQQPVVPPRNGTLGEAVSVIGSSRPGA